MLRQAAPSDLPQLTALWAEVFGDSEAAIRRFFAAFPSCCSYVAVEAGQIVSMVHALPQVLSPDTPAAYLYAVATRPDCRGQGLCRKLLDFAEQALQQEGFGCCVLAPAEPELFRFYEKLGYTAVFCRRHTAFPGGTAISAARYAALREELLSRPHMIYDLPTLDYARQLYDLTFYETATGIAAAAPGYTAEVLPQDPGGAPCAMIKWLAAPRTISDAYLGFALE